MLFYISAERLHNFNVGISYVSSHVRAPIPGDYDLCSHVTGPVGAGVEMKVNCDNSMIVRHIGRYVIIQIVSAPGVTNDYLILCEVSVYAGEM